MLLLSLSLAHGGLFLCVFYSVLLCTLVSLVFPVGALRGLGWGCIPPESIVLATSRRPRMQPILDHILFVIWGFLSQAGNECLHPESLIMVGLWLYILRKPTFLPNLWTKQTGFLVTSLCCQVDFLKGYFSKDLALSFIFSFPLCREAKPWFLLPFSCLNPVLYGAHTANVPGAALAVVPPHKAGFHGCPLWISFAFLLSIVGIWKNS